MRYINIILNLYNRVVSPYTYTYYIKFVQQNQYTSTQRNYNIIIYNIVFNDSLIIINTLIKII